MTWDEVEQAAEGHAEQLVFEPFDVLARLERLGELFRDALELRQRLPSL